jgi:hypothetical protein
MENDIETEEDEKSEFNIENFKNELNNTIIDNEINNISNNNI